MSTNYNLFFGLFYINASTITAAIKALNLWKAQVGTLYPAFQTTLTELQAVNLSAVPVTVNISVIRSAVAALNVWAYQGGMDVESMETNNILKSVIDNYVLTIVIGGTGKDTL